MSRFVLKGCKNAQTEEQVRGQEAFPPLRLGQGHYGPCRQAPRHAQAPPEDDSRCPRRRHHERARRRSEEHTSELQSLMRISYAVFCLKKTNTINTNTKTTHN